MDDLSTPLDRSRLTVTGHDPVLASRYGLGAAAAGVMGRVGLAASRVGEARGLPAQRVAVEVRHAAAALRGFLDQVLDGELLDPDPTGKLDLVGLFATRDGRWVQTYGVFEPLSGRLLDVLGLAGEPTRADVAAAVAEREAAELVGALVAAGTPGAVVLSPQAWAASPQGRVLAARPVVVVERIGDAPPQPLPPADRPLAGVRALDLTRILAGPVVGRVLAEHGADVLQLTAPRLPAIRRAQIDTAAGKRCAHLDFSQAAPRRVLDGLLAAADVVVANARPGSFARQALGPQDVARRRPGIVYAQTDCYGHGGPWSGRPGFEPVAQASTGWAHEHARDGVPAIVPALPCDYLTGYLSALGVLDALARRAEEGGSWLVRTSLARTAMWLREQPGRHDPADAAGTSARTTADLREDVDTPWGVLSQLRPVARMSVTPTRWERPPAMAGTHAAAWLPRAW